MTERTAAPFPSLPLGSRTLHEERDFVENLICQRFNFLLVLHGLSVTAAATAPEAIRPIVLFLFSIPCFGVWATVYSAHLEHAWIMGRLHGQDGDVVSIVHAAVRSRHGFLAQRSARPLIGVWLPAFCCASLVVLGVLDLIFDATTPSVQPAPSASAAGDR